MALIRPQQFYAAKLTRPLDLAGSETSVYVSSLPTETTGSLVINPRSSTRREKITYTGVASSPNRLTGVTRGIPFATVTGTVTSTSRVEANCLRHAVGESIEMVPGHYESLISDILNGIGAMVNDINMGGFQFTNVGAPTLDAHVATKEYADNISTGGGPDASATTKGFVEIATQTEGDSGDDSGSTTAPTVLMPSVGANAVQRGAWVTFTETASGDDAYTATTTPSFTPGAGSMVYGSFATANTTGATFSLNSETPVAIQKVVSGALGALETGDIIANVPLFLYRTASVWVLLSPGGSMPSTSALSEMATFFANTDATGAEVESVTDGSTLTSLHFHKKTFGKAAATNGNIAHGLGVTPKRIKITLMANGTTSLYNSHNIFESNGTTHAWIYLYHDDNSTIQDSGTTSTLTGASAADAHRTSTVSFDATNIVIGAWSAGIVPTGLIFWEAEV